MSYKTNDDDDHGIESYETVDDNDHGKKKYNNYDGIANKKQRLNIHTSEDEDEDEDEISDKTLSQIEIPNASISTWRNGSSDDDTHVNNNMKSKASNISIVTPSKINAAKVDTLKWLVKYFSLDKEHQQIWMKAIHTIKSWTDEVGVCTLYNDGYASNNNIKILGDDTEFGMEGTIHNLLSGAMNKVTRSLFGEMLSYLSIPKLDHVGNFFTIEGKSTSEPMSILGVIRPCVKQMPSIENILGNDINHYKYWENQKQYRMKGDGDKFCFMELA
jgi:hypothetical protein